MDRWEGRGDGARWSQVEGSRQTEWAGGGRHADRYGASGHEVGAGEGDEAWQ